MHKLAHWLLIVGGLNWLLVGLLNKDIFELLQMDTLGIVPKIVYVLVGISAILVLFKSKSSTSA